MIRCSSLAQRPACMASVATPPGPLDRCHPSQLHQQQQRLWQRLAAGAAATAVATALALLPALPATAENVRLQDVDSPTLRSGLQAATEGRLDAAARLFQVYLQEQPDSASGWSNLGNVHLQQGLQGQANEDFTRAISLAPNAAVPYLNRAVAREALGVEAAASGNAAAAARLWQEAIADCDAAIHNDPAEFAAYFDKGNAQMRVEDYPGAVASFEKAANLAPGLAGYRARYATLLFQTGEGDKARQQLRGLVRKYGNFTEAHAALAAMDWAAGRGAEAEEQLSRALEQDQLWSSPAQVRSNTRWPPKLYAAYDALLQIR